MYNREIISYRIPRKISAENIIVVLREAIEVTNDYRYKRTFHLDQGWEYQMKAYVKELKDNRIFQSMSRKGNCIDNLPIENFLGF